MLQQQDRSARRDRVQAVAHAADVREPGRPVNVLCVARRVERAVIAVAVVAVVVWVVAHLVQVLFAVGLIAYVAKLAGRLVRL